MTDSGNVLLSSSAKKINEQTKQVEHNFKKEFLNNYETEKEKIPLVSVSEALRTNFGMIRVEGMITSKSNIYKMKYEVVLSCINCGYSSSRFLDSPIFYTTPSKEDCPLCEKERRFIETKSNYLNAVTAELQDIETFNEIERLPIILFDEDTKNINLGERVTVTGKIEIVTSDSKSKKKPHAVLYARSIEYESKDEIVVTPKDREAIERFTIRIKGKEKIIDELVSMFDHSIIGHNYIKKGLLLAAINTTIGQDNGLDGFRLRKSNNNSNNNTRDRVNVLIIGDPGLAKTLLLKRIVKLVPNSRYESSQNSSGKSLTAIISKEDENYILRLGPVPLAKWAICALNEFGRLDPEDQGHLLDVMEEGDFTINKHGINARIVSPATIIASANPVNNSSWSEAQKINLNEIPALKPIIDRFDLIFVVRIPKDENVIRQYTYRKSLQEDSLIPDYSNYLKKHITYAKRFNPIFSDEAKSILNEFFIKLISKHKKDVFNSPRRRDSIYRIAKAISKLKLKNIVDVYDAKEAIEFYNVILLELERTVNVPEDPRDVAYKECIAILRELKEFGGIALYELFKKACERNIQVNQYFGINKPLKIEHNSKTRTVYDMLLNHSNIKRIQDKPIVLQWITSPKSNNDYNNGSSSAALSNDISKRLQNDKDSVLSDISDTSDTENLDIKKNSDSYSCNDDNNKIENKIDTTANNYNNLSLSDISDTTDKQNLKNSEKPYSNITKNIFNNKKSVSDISDISDSIIDQKTTEIVYDNPLIAESDLIGYNYDPKIINAIYRFEGTDRWGCNHCTMKGDKWFMMKHPCNNKKDNKNRKLTI